MTNDTDKINVKFSGRPVPSSGQNIKSLKNEQLNTHTKALTHSHTHTIVV